MTMTKILTDQETIQATQDALNDAALALDEASTLLDDCLQAMKTLLGRLPEAEKPSFQGSQIAWRPLVSPGPCHIHLSPPA